jgi:fimbrial isopeptide formation D2 family protein/LPXTG-motif cell wall-anchored protein
MSIARKGSLARRVAAAAGAVALGLAGLAGAALTANATGDPTGVGNIVAGKATSLTIHKYSGLEASTHDDGLPKNIDASTHQPLNGVDFKITKVTQKGGQNIDLDTPEGWDLIKGITVDQVKAGIADKSITTGAEDTVTTAKVDGVDGVAKADLDHGLYLVQEGDDHGNNGIVSKTADFLVTLPLPKVESDGTTHGNWIYDVNVYPKNQILTGPSKTINKTEDQKGVKVGDSVEYTIEQTVPSLNAGETYTDAVIYDNLDPAEQAYVENSTVLTNSGTALTADDYTINTDATTGVLNWTLNDSGLAKIKAGDKITVVFKAKVLKVTTTGATLNKPGNGTVGTPGYGSTFNHKTVPGVPTTYSYWGQLQVTKVVQGNTDQKLKDAEFAVSETAADGTCPAMAPAAADAVAIGTSDENGVVRWNSTPSNPLGLFVANSNTDPEPSHFHKDYCLYETKAPAGYILPDATQNNPQKVTITPGELVAKGPSDITVEDEQQNHPNLPLTGAAGTVVMTLGGIALVAAGGAAYAISRKKQSAR